MRVRARVILWVWVRVFSCDGRGDNRGHDLAGDLFLVDLIRLGLLARDRDYGAGGGRGGEGEQAGESTPVRINRADKRAF